ncbi:MAG: ankyrin repeat domain-containing protein [Wolbachia endosymbiont of Tyrophagus putrescentiae]|nr:ankyrin repeat domain-containing protein [Wolbachia endosymbiont of Tyrophagus putrescentiae]
MIVEYIDILRQVNSNGNLNADNIVDEIKGTLLNLRGDVYEEWRKQKFDINYLFVSSFTFLHVAIQNGYEKVIDALLEHKEIDVNVAGQDGQTPLHFAVKVKDKILRRTMSIDSITKKSVIERLIEKGADVNARDKEGGTPLDYDIKGGHFEIQELLLKQNGVQVGCEGLHTAAMNGHLNCVETLVQHGVGINEIDKYGFTALHYAAAKGHVKIVEALIVGKKIDTSCDSVNITKTEASNQKKKPFIRSLSESIVDAFTQNKAVKENTSSIPVNTTTENKVDINVISKKDGFTPLHLAARNGHLNCVKMLIQHRVSINGVDKDGFTALHWAAAKGYVEIVKVLVEGQLIEISCDISQERRQVTRSRSEDILSVSTQSKAVVVNENVSSIKTTTENKADINLVSKEDKLAPLHLAAGSGSTSVVKLLIEKGAKVNLQNKNGRTPLHLAAGSGGTSVVKLLIEKEAKVNLQDKNGRTPLHLAARSGNTSVVELLIEKRAGVNPQDQDRRTPLHLASRYDHMDVVDVLVRRNANSMLIDKRGKTPRDLTTSEGIREFLRSAEKVQLLQQDVHYIADGNQMTSLHLASRYGHIDVVRTLINNGANIEARSGNQYTPLHLAVTGSHLPIVDLLIENGANVNAVDINGKTILHLAIIKGHAQMWKSVLGVPGIEINIQDKDGNSPLHLAARERRENLIRALVKEGANVSLKDNMGSAPGDLGCKEYIEKCVRLRYLDLFVCSAKLVLIPCIGSLALVSLTIDDDNTRMITGISSAAGGVIYGLLSIAFNKMERSYAIPTSFKRVNIDAHSLVTDL